MDFGWAVSDQNPYFTPDGLGAFIRSSDGALSDLFALGLVFQQVNQHHFPQFDPIINLMKADEAQFRLNETVILKRLVQLVQTSSVPQE